MFAVINSEYIRRQINANRELFYLFVEKFYRSYIQAIRWMLYLEDVIARTYGAGLKTNTLGEIGLVYLIHEAERNGYINHVEGKPWLPSKLDNENSKEDKEDC